MKRLIIYGSCQARELGRIWDASPNVRAEFDVRVHWVGDQAADSEAWAHDIADADVVFMQDVPEQASYPLRHWNRGRARFLTFPFLSVPGLWPFDGTRGSVDRDAAAAQKAGHGLDVHFLDQLLGRMRGHIEDPDERLEAYRTLSAPRYPKLAAYLARIDLSAYFAQKIAELRRLDAVHGVSVAAGIASQIVYAPIFHTVTHPAAAVLRPLAGELIAKLGVDLEQESPLSDGFSRYQVPIHPMVARALGLSWAPDGRQWQFHDSRVTFEQYYRHYIRTFG